MTETFVRAMENKSGTIYIHIQYSVKSSWKNRFKMINELKKSLQKERLK